MTDIPLSLKCARTEVLRALDADNAQDEREHRLLADNLFRTALRELANDSGETHDWSVLAPG